eukprot:10595870-Alexandrium_andersonii.AAC.1
MPPTISTWETCPVAALARSGHWPRKAMRWLRASGGALYPCQSAFARCGSERGCSALQYQGL